MKTCRYLNLLLRSKAAGGQNTDAGFSVGETCN